MSPKDQYRVNLGKKAEGFEQGEMGGGKWRGSRVGL